MRRLAVSLTLLFCGTLGWAAAYPGLNDAQRTFIAKAIENELRPGSVKGRLFGLDGLPPRPAILELFVKEVADGLEKPAPVKPGSLNAVLARLAGIAEGMKDKTEIRLVRPAIAENMKRLLERVPRATPAKRSLLRAFSYLGMITPDLLPHFLQIRDKAELTEAAPAVIRLIELADESQLGQIAAMLRDQYGAPSLLNYALLAKTGLMHESELVHFFKYASLKFADALADKTRDDLQFTMDILQDRRHRLVRDQLDEFTLAMARGNAVVRSAFTKAVEQAQTEAATVEKRAHRLLFFHLFEKGNVQWDNRGSWRAYLENDPQEFEFCRYELLPEKARLEQFRLESKANDND